MRRNKRKLTPEEIIAEIAKRNGVSVEEVRFDMTQAIRTGMMNPDPSVREAWSKFPIKDRILTPEELIYYIPKIFT